MSLTDPRALERAKLEKLRALEEKERLIKGLAYLYGFKDYKWSQEFFESRNKMCLLTAANQIGKSTIQIRKMIHWATAKHLWGQLWHRPPVMFWYLYPDKNTATQEYETKWVYLLPSGEFKDHPVFGWREEYDGKKIHAIHFNSGVTLYFKTYGQDVHNLQSGTVDYIGCDEELPFELFDELKFRLAASKGYFSLVFTATLGQEFWRQAMEERNTKYERFPMAQKWQVSTFDCLFYADGSKSHWTEADIQYLINQCSTDAEVQKRIYGKFVLTEGRKYESFAIKDNVRAGGKLERDWVLYFGVDYGSGGEKGHPAAIVCVAVKPDYTAARVVRAWRGDRIVTDASLIIAKYQDILSELTKNGNRTLRLGTTTQPKTFTR
jgi:phage terminase large subunit-like protein